MIRNRWKLYEKDDKEGYRNDWKKEKEDIKCKDKESQDTKTMGEAAENKKEEDKTGGRRKETWKQRSVITPFLMNCMKWIGKHLKLSALTKSAGSPHRWNLHQPPTHGENLKQNLTVLQRCYRPI